MKMKIFCVCACALVLLLTIHCRGAHPMKSGQQTSQTLDVRHTSPIKMDYLLYLPEEYGIENKQWPLVLFLHGAGERGDSLDLVTLHGPPKLVKQGKHFPFVLVSPQCPLGQFWRPDELDGLLKHIQNKIQIDKNRIYVTGLSMGGFGTWALAERYPNRFAAIVPICGRGNPFIAGWIKHLPTWVFHGDADSVVQVENSRKMVEALKEAGNPVRYTEYPGVGHDSWTETYDNPELYGWLLKQERKENTSSAKGHSQ